MRRSEEKIDEDRLLRESARRFLEEQRPWSLERMSRAADGWQEYVDMGWPGMGLPGELNGMEADVDQCLVIMEETGRVLLTEWLTTDVVVASRLGGVKQAAEALEQLAGGAVRLSLVFCDLKDPIGDGRRAISCQSRITPGIARADHHVVVAEDENGGAVVFLIPAATERCRLNPLKLIDGREAGTLLFDEFEIPGASVLAIGSDARSLAEELRDAAIAGLVAECLGALDAGFGLTAEYLKTRKQFGQTLSSFQAVQHLMADAYCDLENLRSLAIAMTAVLDGPAEERRPAVSAAKAYLGRNGLAAVSRCIQVSGGIAITEEYFLGHVYKRLQTAAALFGSTEEHLSVLA